MKRLGLSTAVLAVLALVLLVATLAAVSASSGVAPSTGVDHPKYRATKGPAVKAPSSRKQSTTKRR